MVYKLFDEKNFGSRIKNKCISSEEFAKELQKPIINKVKEKKVQSHFIDNILSDNLSDVQSISKFNKEICFFLSCVDIFSKYAWGVPLKDKKVITITNAFQKLLK